MDDIPSLNTFINKNNHDKGISIKYNDIFYFYNMLSNDFGQFPTEHKFFKHYRKLDDNNNHIVNKSLNVEYYDKS